MLVADSVVEELVEFVAWNQDLNLGIVWAHRIWSASARLLVTHLWACPDQSNLPEIG